MPPERPSKRKKPESPRGDTWFTHKVSRNKFRITKLHELHAEVVNADGTTGYVNLDLLIHDIERDLYDTEPVKKGR